MMWTPIYLLLLLYGLVNARKSFPCMKQLSVNISDGQKGPNDVIVKDNIVYDNSNYYIDSGVTWGCLCNIKKCIQKCCGEGENYINRTCRNDTHGLNVNFFHGTDPAGEVHVEDFQFVYSKKCEPNYFLLSSTANDLLYMQKNGSLYIEFPDVAVMFNLGYYCLTSIGDQFKALICEYVEMEEADESSKLYAKGMIISMPFLLATFLVYLILPESNLHRKALMSYVLTLLLAYIFLVTVQLYDGEFAPGMCQTLGFSVIFFFMVSFFWMNVMCIDMWFAFSGLRGFGRRHTERKRFLFYCLYAWGMSVLHVLIVFLLNEYGDQTKDYYPGVGKTKCFLEDKLPNLLYFYGPMAILITINIVLFILTAVKIQKVKKETSMLKHSDSKRHSYEDDKQKFNLYLKLLFAMGINWTMEIISWAVIWKTSNKVPAYVWYLTDFCNAMYGALIFFIFVFKKKIWKSLQKRYYVFRGKPHLAHSMTTTQTTRSSNYSTTDTGLSDHRLSELRNGRGGDERALTHN